MYKHNDDFNVLVFYRQSENFIQLHTLVISAVSYNWLFITFYDCSIAICTYKCICTNAVILWCIVLYCFTLNMDFESEIKYLN